MEQLNKTDDFIKKRIPLKSKEVELISDQILKPKKRFTNSVLM
jgi:hypothetical protein